MLQQFLYVLVFINVFDIVLCKQRNFNAIKTKALTVWKNATVPFYVDPDHFDKEQTLSILRSLSMFAFKTCIKFLPVMAEPREADVMMFVNPDGVRRCQVSDEGHSVYSPHLVVLGYDCLTSPSIDMMIMKALGFPFEHNRINRDMYINVLHENIEPDAIELFTKEDVLPPQLRYMPYDINSVMHFGIRDYSKNGHRTILIKARNKQQSREGLTLNDIKKIEVLYGPECRTRDRQQKFNLCQSYPGVARKKRQVDDNDLKDKDQSTIEPAEVRRKRDVGPVSLEKLASKSLRVNPDITAPPDLASDIMRTLKDLGIDHSVQEIVEQVYKVSAEALKNARAKYCYKKDFGAIARDDIQVNRINNSSDVLGIVEVVAGYAKDMVDKATNNITKFCEESLNMDMYQRAGCSSGNKDPRCRETYYSTNSGGMRYSTQHRPIMQRSTNHNGNYNHKIRNYARSMTDADQIQNAATETQPSSTTLMIKREDTDETPVEKTKQEDKIEDPESQKIPSEEKKEGREKNIEAVIKKEDAVSDNNTENVVVENKADNKEREADKVKQGRRYHGHLHRSRVIRYPVDVNEEQLSLGANRLHYGVKKFNVRQQELRHKKVNRERKRHKYEEVTKEPIRSIESDEDEDTPSVNNSDDNLKRRPGSRDERDRKHQKKIVVSDLAPLNEEEDLLDDLRLKQDEEANVKLIKAVIDEHVKVDERNDDADDIWKPVPNLKLRNKKKAVMKSTLPRIVDLTKPNEEFYKERWWPEGIVRYVIQDDTSYDLSDMRERLAEVNEILRKKTCVSIKEITHAEAKGFEDFIVIDKSPDYITGRTGGEQKFGCIELFQGGQHRQHAAMMVMAMLGFYFEVSRHDRDKHIRVHPRHVRADKLHHFEKIRSDATLDLPYDYESATHPAWQFWRQLGRTGISTVATYKGDDPDGKIMQTLGQHKKLLSDTDIVKINSVYGIECFVNERA